MLETGRFYPALHRQFLDATDPAHSSQFEPHELQTLVEAVDSTILAEAYPQQFATLQSMANRAILFAGETKQALSA